MAGSRFPDRPLAGILGLSEVLKEEAGELSAEQIVNYATNIERSGQRLHRTLRNYLKILDLDQAANAAQPARHADPLTTVDALNLVEATARSVAVKHSRGSDLNLQLRSGPAGIDREALAVFVEELAENAFGFSRHGTPVLVEFFAENGGAVLRITDKGRGMTGDQIDRVGAFMQFDRKRHEQQGLGLGLSLVGRMLERAAGKLSVQSVVGQGTTATVSLPNTN